MGFEITESTRLMARLHPAVNNRGLGIYNPYFQQAEVDAVYLLFSNEDPKPLLSGVRALNISGAVVAGSFEKDPRVVDLLDELHPLSQRLGTIGMVACRDGKLWGVYQGAFGLLESIKRLTSYEDKSVTVLGAGNVVRGLLTLMELEGKHPRDLTIYNRSVNRAERLAEEFDFVTAARPLPDLASYGEADIFVNATSIGSPWNSGDPFIFPESMIARFDYIVDVTFVPLRPQLIEVAEQLNKVVSPGHRMFLHQAEYVLRSILSVEMKEDLFSQIMLRDFAVNWS